MSKWFKYLVIFIFALPFLPIVLLGYWLYTTFKAVKYIWKEKR